MSLVCPNGQESQPGAPEWLQMTDDMFASLVGWESVIAGVIAEIVGTTRHILTLCDSPRVDYPVFSLSDFGDQMILSAKVGQWLSAHLWDTYCQCKQPPGGCGSVFDGAELGVLALDDSTAIVHETAGTRLTPYRGSYANAGAVSHVDIGSVINELSDRLLIAVVVHDDIGDITPSESGWTVLHDVVGAIERLTVFYRWCTGSDPSTWGFDVSSGDLVVGTVGCWVDVDPVNPFGTIAGESGTTSLMVYPGYTIVDPHDVALGMAASRDTGWNEVEPGGWTEDSAINQGSIKHRTAYIVPGMPGNYTDSGFGSSPSARWAGITVVLQGKPTDATTWYSWDAPGPITYGWAVQNAAGALLDHNDHGGGLVGYHIEKHWALSEGGDLIADNVEWLVYNAALDLVNDRLVAFYTPSLGAVWPCDYISPLPTPGDPPSGVTDPHDPTPATLEGIALEVHRLELKLDAVVNRLAYLTDGLATQQTPTAGVFGQAQEVLTGDFQEVVINALQAMSNYDPVSYAEHEIASGVTGDWEDTTGYAGYRIHLTTIPNYTGRRVSSPTFYEVNSRADQLGWFAPHVSGGQLDYRLTVWEDSIAWCPAPYCDGLVLHLAPGVVATVYGLTVQYRPVN